MSGDSPFLLFKVECPVCKTVNEFEQVRVGAFVEEGRDSDFAPRNVKWRNPRYQAYHPLVFFTATCGNCFYTREFTNEFKEWKSDNNFRTYKLKAVKEKHLEQLAQADTLVKKIGQHLDVSRHPNESAVLKLLLAIFDETLYEYPNHLDIGRFYLRIAWLFREMSSGDNPNVVTMRGLIQELNARYSSLRTATDKFGADVATFLRQIDNHFHGAHLPAEIKSQMLGFKGAFQTECGKLQQAAQQSDTSLECFRKLVDEYRIALLGKGDAGSGSAFGSFASFGEFLAVLRGSWEGVVVDERSAIELAIHRYKRAFEEGKHIQAGNQQLQATYLIGELSRRVGNFDEARQYFTNTIKAGQEFVYQNRNDQSRTALAKKILELAIEQGRNNLAAVKPA